MNCKMWANLCTKRFYLDLLDRRVKGEPGSFDSHAKSTRAPVKECSTFRIKRCTTTLLPQRVLKIVYISIWVEIIK